MICVGLNYCLETTVTTSNNDTGSIISDVTKKIAAVKPYLANKQAGLGDLLKTMHGKECKQNSERFLSVDSKVRKSAKPCSLSGALGRV